MDSAMPISYSQRIFQKSVSCRQEEEHKKEKKIVTYTRGAEYYVEKKPAIGIWINVYT